MNKWPGIIMAFDPFVLKKNELRSEAVKFNYIQSIYR